MLSTSRVSARDRPRRLSSWDSTRAHREWRRANAEGPLGRYPDPRPTQTGHRASNTVAGCPHATARVPGRGRYWDRASDLCRVKAEWGAALTGVFRQKPYAATPSMLNDARCFASFLGGVWGSCGYSGMPLSASPCTTRAIISLALVQLWESLPRRWQRTRFRPSGYEFLARRVGGYRARAVPTPARVIGNH